MLHIHKNMDGSYYISVQVKDASGLVVANFSGNFMPVSGESEEDKDFPFSLDIPLLNDRDMK